MCTYFPYSFFNQYEIKYSLIIFILFLGAKLLYELLSVTVTGVTYYILWLCTTNLFYLTSAFYTFYLFYQKLFFCIICSFFCLFICLSNYRIFVRFPISLFAVSSFPYFYLCLSLLYPICLVVFLSLTLFVFLSVSPFPYLSLCLSLPFPICLFVCLSFFLFFLCLSLCQ